jgi:transcriptional regulator with XRE-family HTH domain
LANLRENFGVRLRELRLRHNWSQEVLAEHSNTSVHFISLIERGVNAPSFETIETFSKCLALEVKEMFDFSTQTEGPKRVRRSLQSKSRRKGAAKKKGR